MIYRKDLNKKMSQLVKLFLYSSVYLQCIVLLIVVLIKKELMNNKG